MADATSDEQKPLKQGTQSIPASDEEEEKGILFHPSPAIKGKADKQPIASFIPNTYQNESKSSTSSSLHLEQDIDDVFDYEPDSKEEEKDASKSPFTICRIVLFLYAFVSILIVSNFPASNESNILANWRGLFKFFVSINIIACILGTCGVYLYRTRWIFVCWVLLTLSIVLTGFLVLAYVFDTDQSEMGNGVAREAANRCNDWQNDTLFNATYTPAQCQVNTNTQLLWSTIGLYVVYCIVGGFAIHAIRSSEVYIHRYLLAHPPKTYAMSPDDEEEQDDISDLSDQHYQNMVDEENDLDIPMEPKKDK